MSDEQQNARVKRETQIGAAIIELLREFDCTPDEAARIFTATLSDFKVDCEDRAEAAWEDHQQSLMESGGPDDSHYRQSMKDAGRGHLIR